MLLSRRLLAVAASVALGGAARSDQPPATHGPVVAWPMRAAAAGAPMPAFTLFGWVSPPVELTNDQHVGEMAAAGMTLMLPAWADSGRREDNLARLDLAAAHGMRCLIWDRRFERVASLGDSTAAGAALLDSIVGDYRSHPGFFGYYLGDEPTPAALPLLGRLFADLRARDPAHPGWNNLFGRGHYPDRDSFLAALRSYTQAVGPSVLCDDQYDFTIDGDTGLFFDNLAGLNAVARESGLPFWVIVLLVGHTGLRQPTPSELSWQAAMALAYGARGVGYFTWWTPRPYDIWTWQPAVIDTDGRQTAWYPYLTGFDRALHAAGETLGRAAWLAATHAGGVPIGGIAFAPDSDIAAVEGRAALGHFADAAGQRLLLIVNEDSLSARRVSLIAARALVAEPLAGAANTWGTPQGFAMGQRIDLDLPAGGFTLLRLRGFATLSGGRTPRITVAGAPAGGAIRLVLRQMGIGGRLELVDAGGRRIWSTPVGPSDEVVVWHGERQAGGRAPAGIYYVRVETPRGVAVARVPWLGVR